MSRLRFQALAVLPLIVSASALASAQGPDLWANTGQGRYVGELIFRPLPDGRHMRLEKPFGYIDSSGRAWPVPAGTIVDGASIPFPFWSLIGGPFEGKYRDASVIHDYYCDVRTRTWRATDKVFYDAMITSGVSEREAKVLYLAVVYDGPRWDLQTIANAILSSNSAVDQAARALGVSAARSFGEMPSDTAIAAERFAPSQREITSTEAQKYADVVSKTNPTIADIEQGKVTIR